jgi:hypothetical protein
MLGAICVLLIRLLPDIVEGQFLRAPLDSLTDANASMAQPQPGILVPRLVRAGSINDFILSPRLNPGLF